MDTNELKVWWQKHSDAEIESIMPKIKAYGALDLEAIGFTLAELIGIPKDRQTRALREELACFFYLLGKVGRMVSAYKAGELPQEDTLFDAGIYAKMMQRIRERGEWI
jgi:hypothetical protein